MTRRGRWSANRHGSRENQLYRVHKRNQVRTLCETLHGHQLTLLYKHMTALVMQIWLWESSVGYTTVHSKEPIVEPHVSDYYQYDTSPSSPIRQQVREGCDRTPDTTHRAGRGVGGGRILPDVWVMLHQKSAVFTAKEYK